MQRRRTKEEMAPVFELVADFDIDDWEGRFPFAYNTSDPQVLELDKAHDLFMKGLAIARSSSDDDSIILAREYLAAAYLCDDRVLVLDTFGETTHRAAYDSNMFRSLTGKEIETKSTAISNALIRVLCALHDPRKKNRKHHISLALPSLTKAMASVQKNHENNPKYLFGCLSRAKLHYKRGKLHKDVGNGKAALKAFTTVLELDPTFVDARMSRLHLWAVLKMKNDSEIYAECQTIVEHAHEDYSEMDSVYALMAMKIFEFPPLGTYEDAMGYY